MVSFLQSFLWIFFTLYMQSGLSDALPLPPKDYVPVLVSGTGACDLIWKKSLKDLEMRSFWAGGSSIQWQTSLWETHRGDTQKRRKQWDRGGSDWSDVATSQGMPIATSSWKRWGTDPAEGLQREYGFDRFRTAGLQACERVHFCFAKCVVIC